ncbi:MAG: PH domain-containing protein [Archangium sp.]|nr:PH domain-containing protein [Archangium sp.]
MELLLRLLKPIFLPLLKLDLTAPHLPEGTSLVRSLKPSEQWLAYRYLQTLFGFLNQFIGVGIAVIALVAKFKGWGLLIALGVFAVEGFFIGLALVTTRVDFELRHYLVGDRSLRVAQGAWKREEVTLSYANVQNIEVNQGPLERVFGFKSLTISTAGADTTPGAENSHLVTLVGLQDADEVRALILGMLKHQRDTGLGETGAALPTATGLSLARLNEVKAAAFALRDAARAG